MRDSDSLSILGLASIIVFSGDHLRFGPHQYLTPDITVVCSAKPLLVQYTQPEISNWNAIISRNKRPHGYKR